MKKLFIETVYWFSKLYKKYRERKIRKRISKLGFENSIVFTCPSFFDSIIGITKDGRVVYSYIDMAIEFAKDCHHDYDYADSDKRGEYIDEAIEFIDYNTIRAIPYAGLTSPVVLEITYDLENGDGIINDIVINLSEAEATGEYKPFYFNENTCYVFKGGEDYIRYETDEK